MQGFWQEAALAAEAALSIGAVPLVALTAYSYLNIFRRGGRKNKWCMNIWLAYLALGIPYGFFLAWKASTYTATALHVAAFALNMANTAWIIFHIVHAVKAALPLIKEARKLPDPEEEKLVRSLHIEAEYSKALKQIRQAAEDGERSAAIGMPSEYAKTGEGTVHVEGTAEKVVELLKEDGFRVTAEMEIMDGAEIGSPHLRVWWNRGMLPEGVFAEAPCAGSK